MGLSPSTCPSGFNRFRRAEVAAERRRQFEVEILSDLLEDLDDTDLADVAAVDPLRLRRYAHRLSLLPGDVLPFWRQTAVTGNREDAERNMGMREEFQEAWSQVYAGRRGLREGTEPTGQALHDAEEALEEVEHRYRASVRQRLMADLDEAITARVRSLTW